MKPTTATAMAQQPDESPRSSRTSSIASSKKRQSTIIFAFGEEMESVASSPRRGKQNPLVEDRVENSTASDAKGVDAAEYYQRSLEAIAARCDEYISQSLRKMDDQAAREYLLVKDATERTRLAMLAPEARPTEHTESAPQHRDQKACETPPQIKKVDHLEMLKLFYE
jgi:hypothetical protein